MTQEIKNRIEMRKISDLKVNPANPRIIKDDKFQKLVKSIKEFPKMLEIRPIVVNSEMMILGGNMRLRACQEAGLKEVPVILASDLTEEEQKEFIIKDNVSYGEFDFNMLLNEWTELELSDFGLDLPSIEDIDFDDIESNEDREPSQKTKIITCPKCGERFDI